MVCTHNMSDDSLIRVGLIRNTYQSTQNFCCHTIVLYNLKILSQYITKKKDNSMYNCVASRRVAKLRHYLQAKDNTSKIAKCTYVCIRATVVSQGHVVRLSQATNETKPGTPCLPTREYV